MHRIKCIEQILQIPDLSASLMVVEIKKHKRRKSIVLSAKEAQLQISRYYIERGLVSEQVDDKDKPNAEAIVITVDTFCNKYSKSAGKSG